MEDSWRNIRRHGGLAALVLLLTSGSAWGFGTLVGTGGAVAIHGSRTAVVRSSTDVQLITQVKYDGTPTDLVWLIAIRNFNDPVDGGVITQAADQAILDALDTHTRPQFSGECDGAANGMTAEYEFGAFGPAQNMALPRRFFPVQDVIDGDLDEYLTSLSLTADEAVQTAISAAVDQNLMIVALRITAADLGVNKVDPIVHIRYPLDPGNDVKLSLRQQAASTVTDPARMLFWVLSGERAQASLTTREIDVDGIEFTGANATNYEAAFDAFVSATQTRTIVTEHAGTAAVGGFENAGVDALLMNSGANFLTRLHARMAGAALRAAGSDVITLRAAGGADYSRAHTVAGFMCAGELPPDMGDVTPSDAGVEDDAAPAVLDMGPTGGSDGSEPTGEDDSGGGGCSATGSAPLLPLCCLLLAFTARRRRR